MQDKTTIVVAHRLSTLLHMDRIMVFDQGKIVEDGTHEALLALNGLYKTLWNAQVGGFMPDTPNDDSMQHSPKQFAVRTKSR
jgi:ATP-binding cassette subfamily B protein